SFCGCYNDNTEELYPQPPCDTTMATYSLKISSIISTQCAYSGCHSGVAPADQIDLTTYQGLKNIVDNGTLLGSIKRETGYVAMPPNTSMLDKCLIENIEKWVQEGALNN